MGNILAESPCCNICNHSFTDTADFVNHVKLHFGGPGKTNSNKRKAVDEVEDYSRKRHSPRGQVGLRICPRRKNDIVFDA